MDEPVGATLVVARIGTHGLAGKGRDKPVPYVRRHPVSL